LFGGAKPTRALCGDRTGVALTKIVVFVQIEWNGFLVASIINITTSVNVCKIFTTT